MQKIRINSLALMSPNSSIREAEYDIIRDGVGYTKLVGKVFYNSIRSNSSKYVSEASKFRNPSDYESSKGNGSVKGEMLSGRVRHLSIFNPEEHKQNYNPVNTLTDGFFKHQNFLFSPSSREIISLNSTDKFNSNNLNFKVKGNSVERLKSDKKSDKKKSKGRSKPAWDTPKFQQMNVNGSSKHSFFHKIDSRLKVTQPEEPDRFHRDEIHDVQVGHNMIGIINNLSEDDESY